MTEKILILGYYDQQNWGDSMFQEIFKSRLQNYNTTFRKLQDFNQMLDDESFQYSKIIIGGGDLINEYFLQESLYEKIRTCIPDIPILFVGVGLTFNNIQKLDIADYFFIRNKTDYEMVKYRYGTEYSYYMPDLVFDLKSNFTKTSQKIEKITIALPWPYFKDNQYLNDFFIEFDKCMDYIYSADKTFTFAVFDTSHNPDNSDYILYDLLRSRYPYITIVNANLLEHFENSDLIIGGRFHSIVLSTITNTPFIALNGSLKLTKLQTDFKTKILTDCFIPLETRNNHMYTFSSLEFIKQYDLINANVSKYQLALKNICIKNSDLLNTTWESIYSILKDTHLRQISPQYMSQTEKNQIKVNCIYNVLSKYNKKISLNDWNKIMKGANLMSIFTRQRDYSVLKKTLTEEILWNLTGDPFSHYYYGLYENIFTFKFLDQVDWIINDYYSKYYIRTIYNNQNLKIINKNFQELHRSGWQYIIDKIVTDLNTRGTFDEPFIIDTYVDKTFHWNKQFYMEKNIVPYKVKWIGFIHHTFSNYNNEYNCEQLLKDKLFLTSLTCCQGLIVMTNYLKNLLQIEFDNLGIHVPLYVVYHPTEIVDNLFTWDNFMNNPNRQVIQIGNWMRDMFAIHRVELPKNSVVTQKAVLKNRNSDNYFLPETFFDLFVKSIKNQEINSNVYDICKISLENMHLKALYENVLEMEKSVNILQHLDNDNYDHLLTNNIVFIKLVDASAVNTLVECIVRNTPIIVNKIEPIVEVLGVDYPLYYETYYEASCLLDNYTKLQSAYIYLTNFDKTRFKIQTFMDTLLGLLLPKF